MKRIDSGDLQQLDKKPVSHRDMISSNSLIPRPSTKFSFQDDNQPMSSDRKKVCLLKSGRSFVREGAIFEIRGSENKVLSHAPISDREPSFRDDPIDIKKSMTNSLTMNSVDTALPNKI